MTNVHPVEQIDTTTLRQAARKHVLAGGQHRLGARAALQAV
jgi:hypothetical protein